MSLPKPMAWSFEVFFAGMAPNKRADAAVASFKFQQLPLFRFWCLMLRDLLCSCSFGLRTGTTSTPHRPIRRIDLLRVAVVPACSLRLKLWTSKPGPHQIAVEMDLWHIEMQICSIMQESWANNWASERTSERANMATAVDGSLIDPDNWYLTIGQVTFSSDLAWIQQVLALQCSNSISISIRDEDQKGEMKLYRRAETGAIQEEVPVLEKIF